jgi:glycosyltransferase involved in cell wall biosynthesis
MISSEFSPLPIPVRLGILQRVLPLYRLPFFEALATACPEGLGVFSGQPRAEEAIETASSLKDVSLFPAQNHHLFSGKFYLCLQTGLMRWLEEWQPQVLILEANPRYLSSPAAVRWMHHRRRPVIGWGLGQPHTSHLLNPARRGFLRQFDALITYSRTGAEEYSAAGYPAQRIFVAPNAAAPRPAAPPPERAEQVERPTVLFTGRLQARKRVDYLLQACAALPPALQPRLIIVGDGPEKPALQALAGKIYPAAQFPGALFNEDLAPHLQQADLFVLPGTGGLAVQQAMAAALPVMAAEADGTQADLVRPENGWRLIPGDLTGLTHTLASALGDIPRLRRMGLESYRIVRDEINLEAMVAAFGRAVAFVLGGKHAHPVGG